MPTWDASPTSTRSLPIRGAWIEINRDATSPHGRPCRSPSGERGLKLRVNVRQRRRVCRSPSGERGLKFVKQGLQNHTRMSLPIRGAWIEIFHLIGTTLPILSLPIRGAWIEISSRRPTVRKSTSRSPSGERGLKCKSQLARKHMFRRRSPSGQRGLKLARPQLVLRSGTVAPHSGSVD